MKLRGVEVSEAVCRLLYRTRLAEITWEALTVVRFVFSSVWHVGRDVHQTGNRWIRARFRNYGSPIAVSDKNAVNAFPARTIRPSAVNQDNIPNAMVFVLRRERAAGQQQ